jgi:hypothetical protein
MSAQLYSIRYSLFNKMLPIGFCHSIELLIDLPLVKQMTEGHQPHFLFRTI